jgi:hypothetical protein
MELTEHVTLKRNLAEGICQRMIEEINKLGLNVNEVPHYPNYDDASFVLIKDPYTGQQNLACYWYDPNNRQRIGRLQFNSDETFYAEYDVAKVHPRKALWFIEAITAWGNADTIKAEAKLLPMST